MKHVLLSLQRVASPHAAAIQAYSFSSAPIAKAFVDASRRGVKVNVILDKSQQTERCSAAGFIKLAHIPACIDARHAIAHNKIMIIDRQTVLSLATSGNIEPCNYDPPSPSAAVSQ